MRRLLALLALAPPLAGCLQFAPDGIYACDPATMKDCLVCEGGGSQLTAAAWCRDYAPHALGVAVLNSMTGAGSDAVFVAGSGGKVIRWNGTRWVDEGVPTVATFNYAWARSASDVWAVGDGATWAHFDGTSWTVGDIAQTTWPTFGTVAIQALMAVAGSTGANYTEVFALDSNGAILDTADVGASWTLQAVEQPNVLWWGAWRAVDGTSFFVGQNGAFVVAKPSQPMTRVTSPLIPNDIRAVLGRNSTDVWVGGADGIFHWDGLALAPATSGVSIWGMCSPAPGEYFAVGDGGAVLHLLPSGSGSWQPVAQPTQERLYAVYCTPGEILIAAESGIVLRRKLPLPP